MIKGCVIKLTKNQNELPAYDGILDVHSPGTLVTGCKKTDYNRLNVLHFGDYIQAHQPVNPTNTNKASTVGAIALYPSGNAQGSWYFMLLTTGERIHMYQCDIITIGEDTIEIVHALVRHQGIPQVNENFVYEVEERQMMADDDDEEEGILWK